MLDRLSSMTVPFSLALLAAVLLSGCASPEPQPQPEPVTGIDPAAIEPVPIIEQNVGNDAALAEPGTQLIQSAEAFEALGADPGLSADAVDFDEHSVIIFALGEQPTGGYWARITGVQREGDTLWVVIVINQPGEDEMVTQQITHPFAAAVIPRVDVAAVRTDTREVTGQQLEAQ